MRSIVLCLALLATTACSRKVRVETAPPPPAVSLKITNTTPQAVAVYVQSAGTELYLKQVPANATEIVPVPGVPLGSTVRLRATLADGSRSYTREGVVLNGVFEWKVP